MGFAPTALLACAGGIAWALHFAAIYSVTALACARGMPGVAAPAIGVATLLAALACLAAGRAAWPRRGQFVGWLSLAMAAMGLFAIVLQALPVLTVPACG